MHACGNSGLVYRDVVSGIGVFFSEDVVVEADGDVSGQGLGLRPFFRLIVLSSLWLKTLLSSGGSWKRISSKLCP